jgi:predicted dehydrogenase
MMEGEIAGTRAAIVGAGNMGRTHAAAYSGAGATVVAVCDVDAERARAFAAAVGADAYTSVDEMLDATSPAVVSICTPPAAHLAPALLVARRGLPFLCEKPLADSLEGAQAIARAASAGGAPGMVGYCHRFHEPVLQIKERLDQGEIGTPVLFRNRFAYRFAGVAQSWFADRAVSGGGTLMDTSVHSLDLYRFLIGEITRVAAQLTTVTPGLAVEDNSVLLVNGPAGVPGIVEASWTTPAGESRLTIYGTEGSLTVDYGAGAFGVAAIQRAGEKAPTWLPRSAHDRFTAEVRHFLSSVAAGRPPSPDLADGVRTLRIIAAAYGLQPGTGGVEVPPH